MMTTTLTTSRLASWGGLLLCSLWAVTTTTTVVVRAQECVEEAAIPFDLVDAIPAYHTLLDNGFQRIHIHLKGLRSNSGDDDDSSGIAKRKNRFGRTRKLDAVVDPYCMVEAVVEENPLPEYFAVHKHTFPTLPDSARPFWDAKATVLAQDPTALVFYIVDENLVRNDQVLMRFTLTDLPEPVPDSISEPGEWTEFALPQDEGDGDDDDEHLELVVSVKIAIDWVVSQPEIAALTESNDDVAYQEYIIQDDGEQEADNALLQSWKSGDNAKAVLWILGRNDAFMHPHVKASLFPDYDLYVLNYSMNGACRSKGWVTDAHWNAHNLRGDFNIYCDQIAKAIAIMGDAEQAGKEYETVVGYAHSTGGPVLLNYLMERGDDDFFDAFLFNSPFLDWGFVGGDLVEVLLESMGWMETLGVLENDDKLGVVETPEAMQGTPIEYLGEEIVLSPWSAKLWSQYYFNWDSRPLYHVPMTGGFAKGVTAVHQKLQDWHDAKKPVTTKPFLVVTSRGDDVLKSQETVSRADWIGPRRTEVELNDNGHDVFLSQDTADTALALDMCQAWLRSQHLL